MRIHFNDKAEKYDEFCEEATEQGFVIWHNVSAKLDPLSARALRGLARDHKIPLRYPEPKKDEIKCALRELGQPVSGTKEDLIDRLIEWMGTADLKEVWDAYGDSDVVGYFAPHVYRATRISHIADLINQGAGKLPVPITNGYCTDSIDEIGKPMKGAVLGPIAFRAACYVRTWFQGKRFNCDACRVFGVQLEWILCSDDSLHPPSLAIR